MANTEFPHPAVSRILSISELTRFQKAHLATYVAAECLVFRYTGITDMTVHDVSTRYLFDSLPIIRRYYLYPNRKDELFGDVALFGSYRLSLTGELERDLASRKEFEEVFKGIFKQEHFWMILNAWCNELVELGLALRGKEPMYLHDVLEPHSVAPLQTDDLSSTGRRILNRVVLARGDVGLALLNIVGGTSAAPQEVRKFYTGPFRHRLKVLPSGGVRCNACGLIAENEDANEPARHIDAMREIRKHIYSCAAWEVLDAKASQLLCSNAKELNVAIDRLLEENIVPGLEEYISIPTGPIISPMED